MSHVRSEIVWFCICVMAVLLPGCSKGPKYHSVRGFVLLDGKPVPGAKVVLTLDGLPGGGQGKIDAGKIPTSFDATSNDKGWFEVGNHGRKGVVAGNYSVRVMQFTPHDSFKPDGDSPPKFVNRLPAIYASIERCPLRASVPGERELRLELSSSAR